VKSSSPRTRLLRKGRRNEDVHPARGDETVSLEPSSVQSRVGRIGWWSMCFFSFRYPRCTTDCITKPLFTCSVRILAGHVGKTRRKLIPRSTDWAGATHESLWARNRVQKWGRSSPTRCFARVQIDRRAMHNLLFLGHLLDRQSDREGDGYDDLCLSYARHLPALQIAIEAH